MEKSEKNNLEIDPKLLDILVCPLTKTPLIYDKDAGELISKKAKLAYPINNGIPVMLPSEARQLKDEEC
jgi:uncharacterized protein YbaR (Trm112 family)